MEAIWRSSLPEALLEATLADAPALSRCPNFWVGREVAQGAMPPIAAAEQVVSQLYTHLVQPHLERHGKHWAGAEYWCQIYEGGRGLGFHIDKDEHAIQVEGRVVTPLMSSVLYLTGSHDQAIREAPTVIVDQRYCHQAGSMQPEHPGWSCLVFPAANMYCLFHGEQAHGVLDGWVQQRQQTVDQQPAAGGPQEPTSHCGKARQQEQQPCQQQHVVQLPGAGGPQHPTRQGVNAQQPRVTLLVNWWAQRPLNIQRATPQDVALGRLAPPLPCLVPRPVRSAAAGHEDGSGQARAYVSSHGAVVSAGSGTAGTSEATSSVGRIQDIAAAASQGRTVASNALSFAAAPAQRQHEAVDGPVPVPVLVLDAGQLQPGDVLPVDVLLEQRGVCLTGEGAVDAVHLRHPGLTLMPLEQSQAAAEDPLHVLAALLPTSDVETCSEASDRAADSD